jgi:hypothetical protein
MVDPGGAEPDGGAAAQGRGRGMAIVAELADAFATALASLAEEERLAAGARVAAVAAAVRAAARSLEGSDSAELAGHCDRAATAIDGVADFVRDRDWRELAAGAAEFARRRPGLFGLGAVSAGYLVGRLVTLLPSPDEVGTVDRRQPPGEP